MKRLISHRKFLKAGSWTVLALTLGVTGCKLKLTPSFPAAKIASQLKAMCLKDYHLNTEVRNETNTLQAFFWTVGLTTAAGEMSPRSAESLERVILCATRVALSTDAPLQFIEVKTADVVSGATVTVWRYVPDMQASMHNQMGEEEYLNRLVLEVDAEGTRASSPDGTPWNPPISLAEFIAKQVVQRAKRQSPVGLQVHEDLSKPSTLVVVIDNWSTIADQGGKQKETVTGLLEKLTKTVVRGYRFKGFQGLIVEDGRGAPLGRFTL